MTRTNPAPFPLAAVGCDFRVAPASLRAALVLSPEERRELLQRLRASGGAAGLVVLDTCNRTEWIVETPHPEWTAELLSAWMQSRFRGALEGGRAVPRPYVHHGLGAVRHFLRVAVGLESLVRGEREIAGQCARALVASRREGISSQLLDQLGHAAGRAVRRMERQGRFRDSSRSVAGIAADFVLSRLADAGVPPVVGVVGLGSIGGKAVSVLEARGARVVRFNRTVAGERCLPLAELAARLPELDGLVVATGAPRPTVSLRGIERERPLVAADLGVPPQVEGPAGANVILAGIDDLPLGDRGADPAEVDAAMDAVELGIAQLLVACERRGSARLLEAVQARRSELRDARLPELLDRHVPDLDPPRRRRLESALSALLRDQQRALLDAMSPDGGASPAAGPSVVDPGEAASS